MDPDKTPQQPPKDQPQPPETAQERDARRKEAKDQRIKTGLEHPRGFIIGPRDIMPEKTAVPVTPDKCGICDRRINGLAICPACRNCQACGLYSPNKDWNLCHLCGNRSQKPMQKREHIISAGRKNLIRHRKP